MSTALSITETDALPLASGERAGAQDTTSAGAVPLVQAHDLAKTFDVSVPWLNRVLERRPARRWNGAARPFR